MLSKETQQIHNELLSMMKDFITCNDKVNHYLVRFHRLYLDGSYGNIETPNKGYEQYKIHIDYLTKDIKEETFRKFALSTFKSFVSIEFFNRKKNISHTQIEDLLTKGFGEYKETFMNFLIDDIKEFRNDHLEYAK